MAAKKSITQRVFWIVSLIIVLTMMIGLFVSFTPRTPRLTPTPLPTNTPFPTRTATPTS